MKRLPLYAMTTLAAAAMTGTLAINAQAAMKTYIIGGSGSLGSNHCLNGQMIDWDCLQSGKPNTNCPDIIMPDMNRPGFPDMNRPGFPDINTPATPDPDGSHVPDMGVPSQPEDETSQSDFAQQVVDLVNEERAKAGVAPLTTNSKAEAAANVRAREIEKTFSHTRPDGSSFSTALTQNGVNYSGSGENIAYGQKTPQDVMDGWMKSAGHKANILNEDFTTIGVGYYQNSAGVGYWTQLFTY